jgi:hypothetical protein
MAKRSLVQNNTGWCSKEQNAGFRWFQGLLNTERENSILNLSIDLLFMSGSMISQSQIHNVVVNKPLKDWLKYLDEAGAIGNCSLTLAGNIATPCAALLLQWIKIAWNNSSPESTTNRIIRCCLSKEMNETDVHALQQEAHEDKNHPVMKMLTVALTQRFLCNF